ncbi:MAG: hypothetical protein GQ574_23850 [Crocinitomix sp.]|nr:hypothetical protein [Crocinitomix sp.]
MIRLLSLILFAASTSFGQMDSTAISLYHQYPTFSDHYKKDLIKQSTGDTLLQAEYQDIYWFSEGLAYVSKNNSVSYIDTTGKFIVPFGLYEPYRGNALQCTFNNGLAVVHKNGKYGAINQKGELVIPLKERRLQAFENGKSIIILNGKHGVIDTNNAQIFPIEYDRIWIHPQLIVLRKNGKMAISNNSGTMLSDFVYDVIRAHKSYDGAVVTKKGKTGFLNFNGDVFLPCIYDQFRWQRNGFTWLEKDGFLLMLDKNGKTHDSLIDGELVFPRTVNDPVGMYNRDSIRYYDSNGANLGTTYKIRFDRSTQGFAEPYPFKNGLCVVYNGSYFGVINAKNEVHIPFEYTSLLPPSQLGNFIAKKGELFGLIDMNNRIILPFRKRPLVAYHNAEHLEKAIADETQLDSLLPLTKITAEEALAIAREKKLFYKNDWGSHYTDSYPKIQQEKGDIYWEFTSQKSGYTDKGDCANTNGCSIIYTRTIKINAVNGKVMGKKETKSIFPNYE